MKNNRGFTLIEILVAVLIIATALLGLVGLQAAGLRNAVTSYNRTQASQLAYSMADRMRANVVEAKNGTYNTANMVPNNATQKTNCTTATCTTAEMAENDLFEWNAALKEGIPKTGVITYIAPVFTIAICLEQSTGSQTCPADSAEYNFKDDSNLTFKTDFQL